MAPMALHLTLVASPKTLQNLSELRLEARFENRGKKPLSAIIDATPLSHGKYTVEFQSADGRAADLRGFGMCGTMAPLMDHEIFLVDAGAVATTPVQVGRFSGLAPGDYRVRVTYASHKSTHGKDSWTPAVKERLKHFWAGTLVSDWVPFAIRPTP
jgi:hypothetical protein